MAANRYFTDTRPEAEAVLIELTRNAPPWRKMEMVVQLNESMRALMHSGLQARYPHADEDELQRRMADLLLGPELAFQVYGPLPNKLTLPKNAPNIGEHRDAG
ncbi:MAG: hypothetical protein R3C14_33980 [Caldilineaceae bacterium]